jgi:hypothetical protein
MKILPAIFVTQLGGKSAQRNLKVLSQFVIALTALVAVYSVLFHFIMAWEGQRFSWLTGVYWTLTVMSTLGFGDITFQSDLGRLFSIVVLLSGTLFMLILLPFTFIQFFLRAMDGCPSGGARSARTTPRRDRARRARELRADRSGADPTTRAATISLRRLSVGSRGGAPPSRLRRRSDGRRVRRPRDLQATSP